MLPHPDTDCAVTQFRREDFAATAERERWGAPFAKSQPPRFGPRLLLGILAAATLLPLGLGLAVAPVPLTAGEALEVVVADDEEATHLETARRFFEELHDQGDLAVAKEIVAPDAVFHIPGGELRGPEGIGGLVTLLRTAFPDATFPIEDVVVDGDTVAIRWTMHGTSLGEFQGIPGIPPTGEPVELRGTAFLRMDEGRIVEDWVTYDRLGLLQQLGASPALSTPAADVGRGATALPYTRPEAW